MALPCPLDNHPLTPLLHKSIYMYFLVRIRIQ